VVNPELAGGGVGARHGVACGLESGGISCVMATACSDIIRMADGRMRADDAAGLVPKDGWQRLSCADGSKRSRLYD
jgi:hypothetical protein